MEARIAVLERIAEDTRASLGRIERRLEAIDGKLDTHQGRVDTKFDQVRDRHDRDFRLTFAAIIAAALGLAGLFAKGFKWF